MFWDLKVKADIKSAKIILGPERSSHTEVCYNIGDAQRMAPRSIGKKEEIQHRAKGEGKNLYNSGG